MQLVLNELSFPGEGDREKANKYMELFLRVHLALREKHPIQIEKELLSPISPKEMELVPGFSAFDWVRHARTDREYGRQFRNLCEHMRLVKPEGEELLCTTRDNTLGNGLQIAAELGFPLLSFAFHDAWRASQIPCRIETDADGITDAKLANFVTEQSILDNEPWIDKRFFKEIKAVRTGADLLDFADKYCPSLVLLDTARNQILNRLEVTALPVVAEKLIRLETYFSKWDGTRFDPDDPDYFPPRSIRPESPETLKQFKEEHTFRHNGRDYLVSYHMVYTCKGSGRPGRIYFYPNAEAKNALICTVYTKLPCVTYQKFHKQ